MSAGFNISRRRFGQLISGGCLVALLPGTLGGCVGIDAVGTGMNVDGLPRGRPEDQGIDPRAILAFLDEVVGAGLELHSFMLARHGHVVGEGWWWPYQPDRLHMMHSLTKSVAVCGIGLAAAEGYFNLDDKVVSFFKEELPPHISDNLAAMSVRDLLTMQTGHAEEISGSVWRPIQTSWVAEFFKVPVVHRPGTRFVYSSAASFMLSAIVTQVTGQRLRDYLEPRLFQPLGIRRLEWDVGPGNINPGGNGLSWTTADSLKLGMLHAQMGEWQGRQILPRDWVKAATTPQVQGGEYGYQWWMGPDRAYWASGLFTQLSVVFPDHDAVLAVTAAIDGREKLFPIIWKHFPAALGVKALPANGPGLSDLRDRTARLRILPPLQRSDSPVAADISGRTYKMAPNEDGVESIRLDFASDTCLFRLRDHRGEHVVQVGLQDWKEGDTSITGNYVHHQYQLDTMRVMAGGRWSDTKAFEMTWQFVESAWRDRAVCRFDGDRLMFDRSVNMNSASTVRPTIRGQLI